ncbi:MAG: hypothetical protein FWD57_02540 [Polyangiaceae bacterium]|nr:hypothetical protein [Polyangiaceae bacterium]
MGAWEKTADVVNISHCYREERFRDGGADYWIQLYKKHWRVVVFRGEPFPFWICDNLKRTRCRCEARTAINVCTIDIFMDSKQVHLHDNIVELDAHLSKKLLHWRERWVTDRQIYSIKRNDLQMGSMVDRISLSCEDESRLFDRIEKRELHNLPHVYKEYASWYAGPGGIKIWPEWQHLCDIYGSYDKD